MLNTDSLDRTLEAMRAAGRIEPIDEAIVAAVANLAAAVDAEPTNASLWREYRAALATLMELDRAEHDDYLDLLERLRPAVRVDADSRQA